MGESAKKMMRTSSNFEESAWHWINIKKENKLTEKVLLGCIYRKGTSTPENNSELNDIIKEAARLNSLVTVCGDFNFPSIPWDCPMASEDTMEGKFICTLDEAVLNQHVRSFTRKRGTDNPSLLDLVITDNQQTITSPQCLEPFGKSDHSLVSWKSTFLCTINVEEEFEPRPNFFKGNYEHMRKDLEMVDWEDEFNEYSNINQFVTRFNDIIHEKIKKYVPMKTKKKRTNGSNVPWMNKKSLKAIKRKYHAWKRYTETKSHARYEEYIKERNHVCKKLRHAKRTFEKNIAKECKSNPKAFYSYFNSFKNRHTNFIRLKKHPTEDFTEDDSDTAEELNKYFQSVFTVDDSTVLPDLEIPSPF